MEPLIKVFDSICRDCQNGEHVNSAWVKDSFDLAGYSIVPHKQLQKSKQREQLLLEAVEFYAEPYNWDNVNYPNMFIGKGDVEEVDLLHIECCGGKCARQALEKYRELESESIRYKPPTN